eukprot:m.244336 g.244336  ORF g.244336 m.244336 type:complete len:253 (+) comp26622_c0_seq21:572-1330(+)
MDANNPKASSWWHRRLMEVLCERQLVLWDQKFTGNFANPLWVGSEKSSTWDVPAFHERCDNRGPTLVIATTISNTIIVGFTKKSWGSERGGHKDPSAFLLRLRQNPKEDLLLSPFDQHDQIFVDPNGGPAFGFRAGETLLKFWDFQTGEHSGQCLYSWFPQAPKVVGFRANCRDFFISSDRGWFKNKVKFLRVEVHSLDVVVSFTVGFLRELLVIPFHMSSCYVGKSSSATSSSIAQESSPDVGEVERASKK